MSPLDEIHTACCEVISGFCAGMRAEVFKLEAAAQRYQERYARYRSKRQNPKRRDNASAQMRNAGSEAEQCKLVISRAQGMACFDPRETVDNACRFFAKHADNYYVGTPDIVDILAVKFRPMAEELRSLFHIANAYPDKAINRARGIARKASPGGDDVPVIVGGTDYPADWSGDGRPGQGRDEVQNQGGMCCVPGEPLRENEGLGARISQRWLGDRGKDSGLM